MSAQHKPPTEDAPVPPLGSQTAAIGIQERLAELLDAHEYRFGFATNCSCEAAGIWFWDDYREHVASVLVAELGLREIRATGTLMNGLLGMRYDGSASPHRYYRTPWEPA